MKIYITGGAKNGKSTYAVDRAVKLAKETDRPLYYIATMIPRDDEDRERVIRHRKERRGLGFTTIEAGEDVTGIIEGYDERGIYLLDSVTALLANKMFTRVWGAWFNENAAEEVIQDLSAFLEKVDHAILVSDYLYADKGANIEDEPDYTKIYMQGLAKVDRIIGALCDELIEVSAGIAINRHKTL